MVRGNIELWEEEEIKTYKNILYYGEAGTKKIAGINLGFCHEPDEINKLIERSDPKPNFIFYGHTHKPGLEKRGLTVLVNPGNIAGVWYPATFAVLDTAKKKLDLKILTNLRRG